MNDSMEQDPTRIDMGPPRQGPSGCPCNKAQRDAERLIASLRKTINTLENANSKLYAKPLAIAIKMLRELQQEDPQ